MANIELRHHFVNGPFVEVISSDQPLLVEFIANGQVIHAGQVEAGQWIRASRCWFCNWQISVSSQTGDELYVHEFNSKDQNIRVYLDSKSLGDTLAWIPQVERFAEAHPEATVYVSYHWPNLIDESAYPNLVFIPPDAELSPCYATYSIGYYFDDIDNHHPHDPRTISLQTVASDILGLSASERRPKLMRQSDPEIKRARRVTIATTSTAACKYWLHEGGWQEIIDWLRDEGYEVMVIQKEPTELLRIIDNSGNHPISERIRQIEASDFFIGLASGLSWLAWALEKPVLMISGFSLPKTEFRSNCERIINSDVCHGCWNDIQFTFSRNEWDWCPRHAKTMRQHECSYAISTEMVMSGAQRLIEGIESQKE